MAAYSSIDSRWPWTESSNLLPSACVVQRPQRARAFPIYIVQRDIGATGAVIRGIKWNECCIVFSLARHEMTDGQTPKSVSPAARFSGLSNEMKPLKVGVFEMERPLRDSSTNKLPYLFFFFFLLYPLMLSATMQRQFLCIWHKNLT